MIVALVLAFAAHTHVAVSVLTADAIRIAGDPFSSQEKRIKAIRTLGTVRTDPAFVFLALHVGLGFPEVSNSADEDNLEVILPCYWSLTRIPDGRNRRDGRAA